MNTFTQFLTGAVAKAQVELQAEERAELALGKVQVHKDVDYLADMYNRMEKLNRDITRVKHDVENGFDSLSSSDYRFAHKLSRKNERLQDSSYFDYLLASQGVENKVREVKKVTESYDFDFTDTVDRLPWKKVAKKATPTTAKVHKFEKALPQASYIPSKPSASTTKYTSSQILKQDGKTPIYSPNFNFYTVENYKVYKMAVVLDVKPVEDVQSKRWFDDLILGLQKEGIDKSRDEQENEQTFVHLVFRYQPLTITGKPNPYCGINQLKNWLKSQDFIQSQAPATLKDALEILKGSTVSIPNAMAFNYSKKSDNLTVYTVFGDFDHFTESFDTSTQDYQLISEYEMKDKDENGKVIKDSYESLTQEIYAKSAKINGVYGLISYDCHKDFVQEIPLIYNHISYIFD